MNLKKTPIALAAIAFCGALPLAAQAAPTVSFKAPSSGQTISGNISQSTACEVSGSNIRRVVFFAGTKQLNTESSAPWQCNIDTRTFADGTYTLKAVAYDAAGASATATRSVNIVNNVSTAPTIAFQVPAPGGIMKGNIQGPPNCTVTGTNIARVMFYLNDVWTNTDGNLTNGLGCWIDTTKYADGAYTLKAVAYNSAGASKTITQAVAIQNAVVNTPPIVSFKAPAVGATLSGQVNSTACEATASDNGSVSKVDFFVGSMPVTSKTAAPYQCAIDTTKFANGTHTLMAVATDNQGASASTQRSVSISNVAPPDPTPPPGIDAADIIGLADAEIPFAQQNGYSGQVLGTFPSASSIPEAGIHGTTLPNGETIRLGKVTDPTNSIRKALAFQLHPSDPTTSGSKRSELSFSPNIEMDKVYWVAFSVYVYDWGTLSTGDSSLFGTQLHSGDNSRGLSPSFSLISNGGQNFQVYALHSTSSSPSQGNTVTYRSTPQPIPFGRWVDFVFKFRQNTSSSGFLQVWMDGTQIVNYQGNLGFNTPGFKDYAKFGYYNWSSAFNSSRKVLLRSPRVVADPTGSKYTPDALRALVSQAPAQ